jgi:4'-phosphopantetheinyl transferase
MELSGTSAEPREVHVWFVELAPDAVSIETCLDSLSADERERVSRFRFEHLKTSFTLSRGILRALLGRYLSIAPDRVGFAYGARGKPRLAFPEAPLEFNLAHSGRFAMYAFVSGCELGVDIEEVRPIPDQENIVRRFFSPEECEEWLHLEPSERDEAFFCCWTRKEAYIKALGNGLSMPLDSFRVSLRQGEPAALLRADRDPAAPKKWSLCSLVAVDGYAASLAVPERTRDVRVLPRLTAAEVLELVSRPGTFPPVPK